ncbi:uncharacterized protein MONBRDRAFT_33059 [Monosiga brevicollis MX1]|uniref:mRNA decay factor PAT1 domain-containing protein n=1 Tax=Monosiga brevicollis TaxID=81824 RepID=A9V3A1_MONBE|nr:uncharacterized protein MONBRDRAFT_33059 [Monosiga brevicollis MX1]EDQ88023.1 predicted protein [Monosiga brevicollis MX1]|eukprot:XP_001747099.1 hypothetical protein [Monosiga brevicollis MX1]
MPRPPNWSKYLRRRPGTHDQLISPTSQLVFFCLFRLFVSPLCQKVHILCCLCVCALCVCSVCVLCVCVSLHLSLSLSLSLCLSLSLSVSRCLSLSLCLSISVSLCFSLYLCISVSLCLFVSLSVYLSLSSLPVSLSHWIAPSRQASSWPCAMDGFDLPPGLGGPEADDDLDLETFGDDDLDDDFDFTAHNQLAAEHENIVQAQGGRQLRPENEIAMMQDQEGLQLAAFAQQRQLNQTILEPTGPADEDDDELFGDTIVSALDDLLKPTVVDADELLAPQRRNTGMLTGASLFDMNSGSDTWGNVADLLLTPEQIVSMSSDSSRAPRSGGPAPVSSLWSTAPYAPSNLTTATSDWGAPAVVAAQPPATSRPAQQPQHYQPARVEPPAARPVTLPAPAAPAPAKPAAPKPISLEELELQMEQQLSMAPPQAQPKPSAHPQQLPPHQGHAPPSQRAPQQQQQQQYQQQQQQHLPPHLQQQPQRGAPMHMQQQQHMQQQHMQQQLHMQQQMQQQQHMHRMGGPGGHPAQVSPQQMQQEIMNLEAFLEPLEQEKAKIHATRAAVTARMVDLAKQLSRLNLQGNKRTRKGQQTDAEPSNLTPEQQANKQSLQQELSEAREQVRDLERRFKAAEATQDKAREQFFNQRAAMLPPAARYSLLHMRVNFIQHKLDTLGAGVRQLTMMVNRLSHEHEELSADKKNPERQARLDKIMASYRRERQRLGLYADLRRPILEEARFIRARLNEYHQMQHSHNLPPASREQERLAKYSNLMRFGERQNLITIAMKQSQGSDPYLDDFYFLHFRHRLAVMQQQQHGGPPAGPAPSPSDASLASFPLLNKNRRYETPIEIDGALGCMRSTVSPRAPKTMIAKVAVARSADSSDEVATERAQRRAALLDIEDGFSALLEIEDIDRSAHSVSEKERRELFDARNRLITQAMEAIHVASTASGTDLDEDAILKEDLGFVRVMCLHKSKALVGRLLAVMLPVHLTNFFLAMMRTLPLLTRAGHALPYADNHVEILSQGVVPTLCNFMQQVQMIHLNQALDGLLQALPQDADELLAYIDNVGSMMLSAIFTRADKLLSSGQESMEVQTAWVKNIGQLAEALAPGLAIAAQMPPAEFSFIWNVATVLATHGGPKALATLKDALAPFVPSQGHPAAQNFAKMCGLA